MPPWALFCVKQMKQAAIANYEPPSLCLKAMVGDAFLIHPERADKGFRGLLVCEKRLSGATMYFKDPDTSDIHFLRLPEIHSEVAVQEDAFLEFVK